MSSDKASAGRADTTDRLLLGAPISKSGSETLHQTGTRLKQNMHISDLFRRFCPNWGSPKKQYTVQGDRQHSIQWLTEALHSHYSTPPPPRPPPPPEGLAHTHNQTNGMQFLTVRRQGWQRRRPVPSSRTKSKITSPLFRRKRTPHHTTGRGGAASVCFRTQETARGATIKAMAPDAMRPIDRSAREAIHYGALHTRATQKERSHPMHGSTAGGRQKPREKRESDIVRAKKLPVRNRPALEVPCPPRPSRPDPDHHTGDR